MRNHDEGSARIHDPNKNRWFEVTFYGLCGLILLFLILPLFVVIPISFSSASFLQFPPTEFSLKWYRNFFGSDIWMTALLNSFKIAILSSLLATTLAIMAALTLTRHKFKGANLIFSFLISPMIVPVIIIAVGSFFQFSRLRLIGNFYTIVLAHAVISIPIVLITISASLQVFDRNLEYAALSLGANPLVTFFKITFPIIRPGVISGALFAFITSFDEVVISYFLSTYRSITLPKHMWSALREQIDPTIAASSTLLILTAVCLLITVSVLMKRAERLRG
jgi:putative spermidine/putrescine transport system permease protein